MSRYKIGEISKLLNLSSEALRHYERQGIISPKRDGDAGYRYYDTWDMMFLMNIIYYRSFGFPLADVDSIINEMDLDGLTRLCHKQSDRLALEISSLQNKQTALHAHLDRLNKIKSDLGRLEPSCRPEIYFQCHRTNDSFEVSPEQEQAHRLWLSQFPWVNYSFLMPQTAAGLSSDNDCWGFSMATDKAPESFAEHAGIYRIESSRALYTIFCAAGRGTFRSSYKEHVLAPVAAAGYTLKDDSAVGNLLARIHRDGEMVRYYEVWVPIVDQPKFK